VRQVSVIDIVPGRNVTVIRHVCVIPIVVGNAVDVLTFFHSGKTTPIHHNILTMKPTATEEGWTNVKAKNGK
jgi:hypothetical protein